MDTVFIRNFVLFIALLLTCAGTLAYGLLTGERDLDKTDDLVLHTHSVIAEAEQLSTLIEGMQAVQLAHFLTNNASFLDSYETKKADVSEHIAMLSGLTSDNPSQQSRLDELRTYFGEFSQKLEERSQKQKALAQAAETAAIDGGEPGTTGTGKEKPPETSTILDDVESIDNLKDNIIRINNAILNEEYALLNERVNALDNKKSQYFNTLFISVVVGTILLLIFNTILLHSQRKRSKVEASLKDTEARFALAVEGTQDGIFDWDIQSGDVFYSRQYFAMLGHDRQPFTGTPEDMLELVHPEDKEKVWRNKQAYLNGELSEYNQEYRMKHSSGRWVWVQSRAKALYDKNGKPLRMVGAHADITHLKKAQERLEAEKKQAEEANRAKSEFLAHMSHEIRTPLTAISGIAEIFEKNQKNFDEKQKKLAKTLSASSASLKDLINDILDFSKIEGGELELDEEEFPLENLFEEIISMMALRASEKGVSFVFDYSDIKGHDFHGDAQRMRQIVVNLIGNAIKFTDEGGVTVKAEFEDRDGSEYLHIDVTDTGMGIAPENFDLVFERFKQADSSVSRKYGGTGLGLPISRNLAKLMGGDIFLSSEVGKGSTFSVLLPVKLQNQKTKKDGSRNDAKKLNDKIRKTLTGKNKALIVEDYEGNIVVISYILDEVGLDYDVAKTGAEAVNLWSRNHYDIVLMDIQMPEMDGFAATKKIREEEIKNKLSRTPIIGMTAHALIGDRDKCIEAGMDAYLPKPIVESDLKKEILKFLEQKREAA